MVTYCTGTGDSRVPSHFSFFSYSWDSRVLSHFIYCYSWNSRVLSHFSFFWNSWCWRVLISFHRLVLVGLASARSLSFSYSWFQPVLRHFSFGTRGTRDYLLFISAFLGTRGTRECSQVNFHLRFWYSRY